MSRSQLNVKKTGATALALTLMLFVQQARADDDEFTYRDEWSGIAGLGVASHPKYVGSDKTQDEALPVVKITYGRFFIGGGAGLGAGYNAFELGDVGFGAYFSRAIDAPRKESDDPHLYGLGDVNATTRAGVFAEYKHDWMRAKLDMSWDAGGQKEGMVTKLSAEAVFHPLPKLEVSVGPRLLYGSSQYEQEIFGIDAMQSSRSGLPIYTPKSGLSQASVDLDANYALSKSWLLGARLSAGKLEGDSATSPIVEKKSQDTVGVFVAYKF